MFVPFGSGHTRRRRNNAFTPINGLLSGMLQTLTDMILHPAILLAAVALLLDGSVYQIAAFTVIALASWTVSAIILAAFHHAIRRPSLAVIGASSIRLLAIAFLAFTAFRSPNRDPDDVVRSLLTGYVVYQVSSAVLGQISVTTLVGTPPTTRRAMIFRHRTVIGAIVAVIAGAVVWSMNRSVGDIRDGLGALFVLVAISAAAATWFLLAIPDERRHRQMGTPNSPLSSGLFRPLRSGPYRRYLLFRVALGLAAAADPFIIVFGFRQIGLGLEDIGLALVAFAIGHLAGVLIWPRWSAQGSPRAPLQFAALLRLLALIITIAIPAIVTSSLYTDRFSSPELAVRVFLAQFALIGLAISAHATANQRYLLDIMAPASIPQAIATTNVVHGILAFAPFVAAYLLQRTSLEQMLWIAAATAFVALLISGFLVESCVYISRRMGVWKQQRRLSVR